MKPTLARIVKCEFKDRLNEALTNASVKLSPTVVAREYNSRADGPAITSHAVRKWLLGEAIPTQPRLHVLARWLAVSPQWLRFGDSASDARFSHGDGAAIAHNEVRMLADFRKLDASSQAVVRDLIGSLLQHCPLRS
jgi:hypothetical protein